MAAAPTNQHDSDGPDPEKASSAAQIEPKTGATAVVDAATERRVVRKLDFRIVPLVSFLSGFGPGIPYLLSFFYLRHELGFRSGLFLAGIRPLATCFSGALAYGITSGHPDLPNWRLLFLVEGLPTILMAPVAYFFLPDTPQHARFLTPPEKAAATARGVRQVGDEPAARVGGLHWPDVAATLRDPKPWLTALMYFSCNVSYASLPVFRAPFFLSACLTVLTTWVADRTRQRGLVIIGLCLVASAGYVLLATCRGVAARYAGVFLAAAGVFPAIGNILPWVMNNQGTDSRRGAGMVMLNAIGQCGPLLGTNIFPARERPYYGRGQAVCAAFMFFTALLALALRALLRRENRALDRRYGTLDEQQQRARAAAAAAQSSQSSPKETEEEEAAAAVENYGPMFRYIL
ncbi:uncharacterized protein PG986_002152 [Apiospora aurea]|uniref:MFS transporter n=1 Tax=Apiospora aurea TaxID=335848 RepID=A0ABR1R0Q8_9PEZI